MISEIKEVIEISFFLFLMVSIKKYLWNGRKEAGTSQKEIKKEPNFVIKSFTEAGRRIKKKIW